MNLPPLPASPAASRPESVAQDLPLAFDSRELLRGVREVLIRHAGQVYRLRHTRNDKLILVK
jgi:hemin uptake protein HemP